jgi:hypothetical protein
MMNKSLRARGPLSSAKPRYGFQQHAWNAETPAHKAKKRAAISGGFESL